MNAKDKLKANKSLKVSISNGNSKMGDIKSVSLPSGKTCRKDCPCFSKCYSRKIERLRKTVREAYQNNYDVLKSHPDYYWMDVERAIMTSRFFRFHVSGDIPNKVYFRKMIEVAKRNPKCEILCFTKRYQMVNSVIREMRKENESFELPKNLYLIFSGWKDLKMENPFHFPEAHVRYKDGSTTANENAIQCNGNCTECAITDGGCWNLKANEQVIFDEH